MEAGKTPYDEVQWETRTATIGNDKGSVIFEQREGTKGVEAYDVSPAPAS